MHTRDPSTNSARFGGPSVNITRTVHSFGAAAETAAEATATKRTVPMRSVPTAADAGSSCQVPASLLPVRGCQPLEVQDSCRHVPLAKSSTAPPLSGPKIEESVHWTQVPTS